MVLNLKFDLCELVYKLFISDWKPICPDSGPLPVRRRQRGGAACQLLLHHARPTQQEEDQGQGTNQVALTTQDTEFH